MACSLFVLCIIFYFCVGNVTPLCFSDATPSSFDDLLLNWKILTQEDWNVVLFNGMEKTSHWAALYFVALMTFGNYVLFNLLVAILVEGFSAEDERKSGSGLSNCSICDKQDYETSTEKEHQDTIKWLPSEEDPKDNIEKEIKMKALPYVITVVKPDRYNQSQTENLCFPPVITHTAATPQGSPNATLTLQRDVTNRLCPEKAVNVSNLSIVSTDKSLSPQSVSVSPDILQINGTPAFHVVSLNIPSINLPTTPQNSRRNSACLVLSRQSSIASNKSRKNSLGPCLNLQRKGSKSSNCSNQGRQHINSFHNWKSHRRKKSENDLSENGSGSDDVVLNNMTTPFSQSNLPSTEHSHCNGGIPTLKNTPNNKRPIIIQNSIKSPKALSPQNSIRSVSSSHYSAQQASHGHVPCSRQVSVNSSIQSQNTLSPTNTYGGNSYLPSRQNSLSGSSLKEEYKPNNLDGLQTKIENNSNVNTCEFTEKHCYRSADIKHRTLRTTRYCHHRDKSISSLGSACVQDCWSETEGWQTVQGFWQQLCWFIEPKGWIKEREDYSLFLFPKSHVLRKACNKIVDNKWFDYTILVFIAFNCITLAMERPTIPPFSAEREFLTFANYVFTVVFAFEMACKVLAKGLWYGPNAYFKSGWNIMDGFVVAISLVDVLLSFVAESSPRIFGILRVFRLLRSLRPLRVINRAPGLKLVVQTLLSSLRPIGNIVLICCTFFIIFGILGVQLFKGSMYYCEGPNVMHVKNKSDCLQDPRNVWQNRKYNFDNLGQALMALFVLSSKDGWVNIMYTGLDAVGVDQQPIENYNEWRLLYFISFLLLVAFFVLNMFVGVVVENFHRCREQQELEEKARRAAKRAKKMDKKRRKMREPPYYINYSKPRLFTHNIITSKYFDLAIAAVIGLNVVTMAMEFYMMPYKLEYTLKIFNYFFTAVFILEAFMKVVALGSMNYIKNRWNQLDIVIVGLSIAGIILEKMESDFIPINPTIIRVMRVLRIARVLKLLKMAKGIRALLDTVMQALPQVGNLGLLFFLLFFIFAALGVELFGRLECTEDIPCEGLGEHAHFKDFGMAFLTLFRVATGDNWNGIMKDTLRDNCDYSGDCIKNCCISPIIAPLYFVVFVLMAQFVLVNVVVAVLMKHLEDSHKHMDDDIEMDAELERELAAEVHQRKLVELGEQVKKAMEVCKHKSRKSSRPKPRNPKPLVKMASLPPNFIFPFNNGTDDVDHNTSAAAHNSRNSTDHMFSNQGELSVVTPIPVTSTSTSIPLSVANPNVNIRQASPDDADNKVTVANLSPVPLRSSFGSTLTSPNNTTPKSPSPLNSCNTDTLGNVLLLPSYGENDQDAELNRNDTTSANILRSRPLCEWTCVFASSNTDPFQVKLLPVIYKDVNSTESILSEDSPTGNPNLSQTLSANIGSNVNSMQCFLPNSSLSKKAVDSFDSASLTDSGGISLSPAKTGCALRTAKIYSSGDYDASYSSPSLFDSDSHRGDDTPLIVKRFRKKHLTMCGESSLSSQSDVPDDVRDKSAATDSTSLEC